MMIGDLFDGESFSSSSTPSADIFLSNWLD
jgi:hypothetical protein